MSNCSRKSTAVKAKIQALTNKIDDLEELSGQGSEEDRRRRKAMINAATSERATLQLELTRLEKSFGLAGPPRSPPSKSPQILRDFATLLENAASGNLGEDVVYKAFRIFRQLTGGRIWVHVEQRPGRKQTNVRGVFTPQLLAGRQGGSRSSRRCRTATLPKKSRCGSASRRGSTPSPSESINSWTSRT